MKQERDLAAHRECPEFQDLLGQAMFPENRIDRLLALAHFHTCPGCDESYRRIQGFFDLCRALQREAKIYQTID